MTGGTLTLLNDIMPGLLLSGGDVVLASNFQGGSITNLTLDGSLLTGVNAVAGTMTILSGGLEGSLTIAPTGTLVFSGATQKTLYRSTLVNYGTMRWQGGNLSLGATPTTLITNAGSWEITGNDNIFQGIGGPDPVIVNDTSGTIRKLTATGVTTFSNVKFENRGTFEALNGSVQFNGSQNSILGGAFNTEPGAAINFASGTLIENGAVFTGAGSSRMTGGTLTLIKDQINGLSLAGGDVDIGPGFQDAGAITNLTISGATLIGVNQVSKGTLTVTAGGIEGTTTILPTGNLVFSGATQKTLYRTTLLNHGSVSWSGGNLSLGATPTTLITNTGLWEITGDDTMFQGIGGPTPVFANLGTLRKIAGSGVTTLSNLKFANAGSVEVRAGTIQHSGAVTSTLGGTIDTSAGAAFTLASGSYTESGGSFTGPGTSRMTGGTLTLVNDILDGLALNNGDVKINSTFQSNGAITNLTLDGATLIGTNQVAGTLAIRAGGTEGELTVLPAGTLLLDTSAQKAFYRTTLHNNGAVKWLAGNLSFGATPTTIINNSGLWEIAGDDSMFQGIGGPTPQFNNAPSGHVKKIAGSGVTSINNVTFANTGTVEAQSGTFRFPNNYTHNTGTLRLSGGRIDASGLLTFASGTLEGSGVFGNSIFNGGSISPGVNGPGKITFPSGLKLTAAATVSIDGQNSTPGSGHDQLAVTGAVDLAGANLQVTSMSPMLVGARMNIIENDATDAVIGTFSSKPEGYLFQTGAQLFRIRYSSGAGNDVALIRDDGGVRLTAIRYQSDGSFLLRGLGTNSGIYRISATTNFQSWIDLGETTANGGGLFEFTDTNAHQFPARFYQSFGPGIEVE